MHIDSDPRPHEWNDFVAAHPDGHILQTAAWADLKRKFGWSSGRVALRDGEHIVAGAQVLFRRLAPGLTLAYVPKGPVVDLTRTDLCSPLFGALDSVCRAERAFVVKLEPDLPASPELTASLGRTGFLASEQAIQPRRTIVVDVTGSEDQILQRMKSKTRYNIRLAQRKGVEVHIGNQEDVHAFNRLMEVTGERDRFGVHSPAYYHEAYRALVGADLARLFLATYEGQPIAGLLACACGRKAWYMYGASGDEHRSRMPAYALQWAAIRWARWRGCAFYDLWGVPDEDLETLEAQFTERHDGLWGVYRNKRGYGGELVRFAGAFDRVYSRPLYRLYRLAQRLRSSIAVV